MPKHREQKAHQVLDQLALTFDQLLAIRFAVNVVIATWIVWNSLQLLNDTNPIWAIASMVAASDPQPEEARRMFKARLTNVFVGCIVGLLFLILGGAKEWMLPVALGITVLISSFIIRIKTMWRQAPITAAVVIASGIMHGSSQIGIVYGLHKVAEVIFGCFVGLLVSWLMSKFWIIQPPDKTPNEKSKN
ncbi:FUSC family protein [Solitalea lacus]|uniref:FUSC family protein n=1 Tax=Solitalea lacus TaxID=2911172 RepID=UPI001EDC1525|nr:FUSC family protein [Solitalea lacus]UKJ08205.1 FUSC family protein [Solitalea lacus]